MTFINPSASSSDSDPYIAYGRGGAGNMRRQSTIHTAWLHANSPNNTISHETAKRHSVSTATTAATGRRRSSVMSLWGKVFGRKAGEEGEEVDGDADEMVKGE